MARTEAEFNIVARDKTKRGFDSATKRARSAADNITKAARVAGGALAVFGGTRAIRGALRATAQIDEMGDVAGVSAERIQELTKSFSDLAGVSESITQGGLRRFNRRLDLARDGTGAAVDTLNKLNITLEQDTESALNQAISRLQEMAQTQSITGEASQLFGEDAGPKMAAALSQGENALREQIRALREHGRVMSNEASEAARRLNDRYNEIADTLNTRFQRAIVGATSGIQDFLNVEPERFQIQEELKELRTSLNGLLDLRQRLQDGNPFFTFFADLDGTNERIQETNSRMVKLQKRLKELRPDGRDDFGGASKKQNELLSQKQELLEAIQTPAERFAAQQEQINELVEKTSITQEQANKRIAQLREEILGSSIEVQTLTEEVQALNQAAEQRGAELLAEQIEQIRRTVDPTRAGLLKLGDNLDALSRSDLPTEQVEQLKIGLIDAADGGSKLVEAFDAVEQAADERIRELGQDVAGDSGEKAGDEFASGFERQAERIGDSIADALISGDFNGVGSTIGASVGSSISDSVGESLSQSLSRSFGESIGTALGAGIGGAVGGAAGAGVGQLAGDLFDSVFGGSDFDPTERRQAEQGTGTVLGSIDAKSESISDSVEEISEASNEIVNINSGMLRSLEQVQQGIGRASALIAQNRSDVNFRAPDAVSDSEQALQGGLTLGGLSTGSLIGSGVIGGFGGTSILGGAIGGGIGLGAGTIASEILGIDGLSSFIDDITGSIVGTIDDVLGGALSSVGNALFGGDRKVVDEGIDILRGGIQQLTSGTVAEAFATIKEDGGLLGNSDKDTINRDLTAATNRQFQAVFRDIFESVEQGAKAIGVLPSRIQSRLDDFVLEAQRISLEGLNAEEQAEELNSVFSKTFDQLATDVIPFLEDFQDSGEGLGETLARVGTQVGVLEETFLTLGKNINQQLDGKTITDDILQEFFRGDRGLPDGFRPESQSAGEQRAEAATDLSQLLGGTEEFARAISGLEDNFLSASEQFKTNQRRLKEALGDLPLPETREGFLELARAQITQNGVNEENLATILRVRDSADEFFDTLEDRSEKAAEAERERQREIEQSRNSRTEFLRRDESPEERVSRLNERLDAPAIESQSALDEFVNSLDLTEPSARKALEQVRPLASALRALADAEQQRLESVKNATDSALSGLEESVNAEIESIRNRRQSLQDELSDAQSQTDAVLGDIRSITQARREESQQQLENEREAIQARADARREAISTQIDAEQDRLSRFESLFDAASSALDNLMPEIVDDSISFERAMGRVRDALRTGGIGAADDLQRISEVDASRFGSRFEFERTQGRAAATLSEAQERAGGRVSAAERQIEALESQKAAVERSAERQIEEAEQRHQQNVERLDGIVESAKEQVDALRDNRDEIENLDDAFQGLINSTVREGSLQREIDQANFERRTEDLNQILTNAESQLDALRGIDDSIKALGEALPDFREAVESETGKTREQQIESSIVGASQSLTRELVGQVFDKGFADDTEFKNPRSEGVNFFADAVRSGDLAASQLIETIQDAAQSNGQQFSFADGGIASGPQSGFPATLHGTEAVIPLNGGSVPVNVNNDELIREIRALRQETRAVGAQQTEQAKKTAKLLSKFDIDGLPETRT